MGGMFDATEMNGMKLKNRLVRSATWDGMCDEDGRPTQRLADWYGKLAEGGVGLLISGYTFVHPGGKQLPGKMGIHTDDFMEDLRKLPQQVHEAGGKIALQLVHAGGQADSRAAGGRTVAPSAVEAEQFKDRPEALSREEIEALIEAFAQGARRGKEAGFDAVQLHGAHGYLINQFLSPLLNRRTDAYGGDAENRRRFLMEIYRAVRKAVGDDYPVMIKLNSSDCLEGGLGVGEALEAAMQLDSEGIDAIEVSGGTPASGHDGPARMKILGPDQEAYFLSAAKAMKEAVGCPIISVGGYRSRSVIEGALASGAIDYVSMARPLIRQPDLPNRWKAGERIDAECKSCNRCFGPGMKEGGIYCVQEKKEREVSTAAYPGG